jgi:predicted DNA repair protein MutK
LQNTSFIKSNLVLQASVGVIKQDAELEKVKIKSAITTDFILSVEIVIIALSTVLNKNLSVQILTISLVSIIATVGVYGIVALVVRMDDFGFKLIEKSNKKGLLNALGHVISKSPTHCYQDIFGGRNHGIITCGGRYICAQY